jgi:hypothetical protein
VEVLNELYVRNVKKILAEPTRRFPHTRSALSAPVTCNRVEQTLSTQLYSARLTRQEERKDSKDMQGYLARGLLHLQEALLNVHPYIQFLLAVISSSLTNHSR